LIELQDYSKSFKLIYKLFPKWVQWIYRYSPDRRRQASCDYPLGEVILMGLCMFLFRYPSLRAFVTEFRENQIALANFNEFFTLKGVPSDDEFRYALSKIPTQVFNKILQKLHQRLERKKRVQALRLMDKYDLVALDGSGQLSSYKLSCPKCLTRTSSKCGQEQTLYLHGQLVASLISAQTSLSLTMCYEPIENDGTRSEYKKNDSELAAAKRLLKNMNSLYPRRPFCITGDNLFAVAPLIKHIKDNGWSFIITAKPERNIELFSWYDYLAETKQELKFTDEKGHQHHYQWSNKLPLKQDQKAADFTEVNLLEYSEISPENKVLYYNTWITDIYLHENNIKEIAKGGRARFTIENVTFNEQKTRGYHTEHNYGHFGNLPNVFFGLAQIAHLFSQMFSLWREGKRIIQNVGSNRRFWERMATLFSSIKMPIYELPIMHVKLVLDSS
jgi:hypothetical protein